MAGVGEDEPAGRHRRPSPSPPSATGPGHLVQVGQRGVPLGVEQAVHDVAQVHNPELSAYYAREHTDVDDLAADHLRRFPQLALFGMADLVAHEFEVVPTFRTPHVTIAFQADLDARPSALGDLRIEVRANPYTGRWP